MLNWHTFISYEHLLITVAFRGASEENAHLFSYLIRTPLTTKTKCSCMIKT